MRIGRFGGALVTAGSLVEAAIALTAQRGGSVGLREDSPGAGVVLAAVAAIAVGALWTALSGAAPFTGRVVRVGLGLFGIGVLMVILTTGVPVESMLVVVYLLGGLIAGLGVLIIGWGLLISPGRPRRGAVVFLAGLGLASLAGLLTNAGGAAGPDPGSLIAVAATGLALAGGTVMLGATAWLGALTLRTVAPPGAIPG